MAQDLAGEFDGFFAHWVVQRVDRAQRARGGGQAVAHIGQAVDRLQRVAVGVAEMFEARFDELQELAGGLLAAQVGAVGNRAGLGFQGSDGRVVFRQGVQRMVDDAKGDGADSFTSFLRRAFCGARRSLAQLGEVDAGKVVQVVRFRGLQGGNAALQPVVHAEFLAIQVSQPA